MKVLPTLFSITLIILLSVNSGAVYGDPGRKGPLFEHNYAGKIMEGEGREGGAKPRPSVELKTPQAESERPSTEENPQFVAPTDTPTPQPSPSPSQTISPADLLHGIKVLRIGAIINGMEEGHRNEMISKLVNFSISSHLPLYKAYVVGPMLGSGNSGDLFALSLQGGTLEGVTAPPQEYTVTRSPTWILETEKGDVLLEGLPEIEKFINSQREFVGVQNSEVEASR